MSLKSATVAAIGQKTLLTVLLFCLSVLALPLSAQQIDNEAFNGMIARWNATLDFSQGLASDPEVEPQNLGLLADNVRLVAELAANAEQKAEVELKRQENLLQALGPAPEEGQPPEAEGIAKQRATLENKIALYDARVKQSRIILARSKEILKRISGREIRIITGLLGKKSRSPLAPEVLAEGIKLLPVRFASIGRSVTSWWNEVRFTVVWTTVLLTALMILLGFVLIAAARRWLVTHHGMLPETESPSLARRFVAIIVETFARVILPIVLISVAAFMVITNTEFTQDLEIVFHALIFSLIQFVLITGLSRTALSAEKPQWRIINFTNDSAASLEKAIVLFAIILFIVNLAVVVVNPVPQDFEGLRIFDFETKSAPTIVVNMVGLVAASCAALNVLRTKNWRFQEPAEVEEGAGEQPLSLKVKLLFSLAKAAIVGGVVLYLLGYLNLGLYIGGRTVITLCLIALAVISHGLVAEGLRQATSSENVVGQWVRHRFGLEDSSAARWAFWIVLFVDLILILGLALILLYIWGVPWDEIKPSFTALLYGTEIGGHTFSLVNLGIALGAFILVMIAVKLFQRFLSNRILVQTRLDVGVRDAVTAGVGYAGVVVAALVGLSLIGLKFGEIALIFSALSIGIGFGLQHIVNNFISGLILLVQRPIKSGDWIVIGETQGYVKRIQVISTEITTFDNATVIVPNSQLMTTELMNWTHRSSLGRVVIPVGVSYSSNPAQVKDILLKCAKEHPDVLGRPPPSVVFRNFGDSSLDFELRIFIREIDYTIIVGSDLRFAIKKAFDEAGVEIPFPQRDVHLKNTPVVMEPSSA